MMEFCSQADRGRKYPYKLDFNLVNVHGIQILDRVVHCIVHSVLGRILFVVEVGAEFHDLVVQLVACLERYISTI